VQTRVRVEQPRQDVYHHPTAYQPEVLHISAHFTRLEPGVVDILADDATVGTVS
jgi:hypothetical protein